MKCFLPFYEQRIGYGEWAGEFGGGYFKDDKQVEKFLRRLEEIRQK